MKWRQKYCELRADFGCSKSLPIEHVVATQTDLNMFDTPVVEKNFECHIFPLCYYASKSLRNRKSCNNACKSSAAAAIHVDDMRIIFIIAPKSLMCTASMWG